MRQLLIIILIFPTLLLASGQSPKAETYGELLLETKAPTQAKQNITLFYGTEIDNVYFQTQLASLQYERRINSYFDLNVEGTFLQNEDSQTLININQSDLTKLNATKMNYGFSAGVYFKPLFGQINFLSIKSLPFQLGPTLSVGFAEVESKNLIATVLQYSLGIKNNFDLSKKLSLQFSLEENFRENTFGDQENLTRLKIGLGYLF
jgi:hypothetical protein